MNTSIKKISILMWATSVIGLIGVSVGMVLYLSSGASFAPWSDYISGLSVGPNGSAVAYIVTILGMGITATWFLVAAPKTLASHFPQAVGPAGVARVFGILSAFGLLGLVLFPLDPSRPAVHQTHLIAATLVFFCMAGYTGAYVAAFSDRVGALAVARWVAGLTSVLAAVVAVVTVATHLLELLSPSPATYLLEWITFSLFALWLVIQGAALWSYR